MIQGNLRRFPSFDSVDDSSVRQLERAFELRRPRTGASLIKEGAKGRELFLVLSGTVEVRKRQDGDWAVQRVLGPGQLVGVLGLISGERRTASVIAGGTTTVAALSEEAFIKLRYTQPTAYARLMQVLCVQLARDNRAVRALLASAMAR